MQEALKNQDLAVWQDFVARQHRALDKVDGFLAVQPSGTPTPQQVQGAQHLIVLTEISAPQGQVPAELETQVQELVDRLTATHHTMTAFQTAVAGQLDKLPTNRSVQDRGPLYLDTQG